MQMAARKSAQFPDVLSSRAIDTNRQVDLIFEARLSADRSMSIEIGRGPFFRHEARRV